MLTVLALTLAIAQGETPKQTVPNYDIPFHGKGQYCESKDGKIYYEIEGSGPAIFIIAGGPGGGHASFHPWFSRLAKDHTMVYFDNIGRARSDKLKDKTKYTVERDAEDVEVLRRHLKLDKIDLIGHSYGGMPAIAYAVKYGQNLKHLVLSDTLHSNAGFQANIDSCNHHVSTQYPDVWRKLLDLRKKGVMSNADEYGDLYGSAFADLYFYDPAAGGKLFRSGMKEDGFNPDVYTGMIGDDPEWKVGGTMKKFDPRTKMKGFKMPVLICVGRYDRVAVPKVSQEMNDLIPGSKIAYFDKSGHRPWLEETDLYFKIVGDFLAG